MRRPPFAFRWLLRTLPRRFRETHGADIVATAADYADGRSLVGRAYVWSRAAIDVLAVAVASRRPGRGTARGPQDPRPAPTLDGLTQDIRHAARSLRADARFVVFATLIVGLGIGASLTVFNLANALLLQPLPFHEPERLVWISNGEWGRGQALSAISVQVDYVNGLRDGSQQLDDVAGYHLFDSDGDHVVLVDDEAERATRLRVTGNLFDVLGVRPLHGRLFTAAEAWDDGPAAILLTHSYFARRFDADPSIVGRTISLDDAPVTVVGVLPPSFGFETIFAPGRRVDYVSAYPLSARSNRSGNTLGVIARLAPGATIATASAEVTTLIDAVHNEDLNGFDPVVHPLRQHITTGFQSGVLMLGGAVVLVMLIVCANLSNLLLARGGTRGREMAVRAAIGAPRGRLVRQLLAESLMLSTAGAGLGLGLAYAATRMLAAIDLRIPLLADAHTGTPAVLVAISAAVLVGAIFGIAPALRGTEIRLHEALKESGRGSSAGRRQGVLRGALVISEVALACVLLIASTLLVRSFVHLLNVDLGYRAESAVALRIDPSERFSEDAPRVAFYGEILDRVRRVPGVLAVGLTDRLPMGFNRRWDFHDPERPDDERRFPFVRVVSDGYLDAMGSTLVAGRDFATDDAPGAASVALINRELADSAWPAGDAIGKHFRSSGHNYEVIGVVRGTRQRSVDQEAGFEFFLPLRQVGDHAAVHMVVRGDRPLEELVAATREQVHAVEPTLPLDQVTALRDVVDASIAPQRFLVGLLTGFAAFALVLASLGIYGVISYAVVQRRQEIGIHMALGATRRDIEWTVVRETLGLAGTGLVIGLIAAAGGGRLLESLLYGVTPLDATTYIATVLLLGVVAAAAGYLPARRASMANPLDSLSGDAERSN